MPCNMKVGEKVFVGLFQSTILSFVSRDLGKAAED